MDRESDHDDMEAKDHTENGAETEEDSDFEQSVIMRKLRNEPLESADEFRRMYESHVRRPPQPFTFGPHIANERLLQYTLNNYLQSGSYQYQNVALPALAMTQPPFQSTPSSRAPSPHARSPYRSPPFQSPPHKRSASVSSRHSREESASPVVQSSWSFEEQFKQLYDIDRDDPKRKEFLDDLFHFMQKHETPVTRLPIMAKSVLDLYELYKLVVQRGGLVDVINKKLWQEVIKGLNLPSSITSAAFTLRTQYMKFLYRYECHKLGLSSQMELQAAIEGNKREGRRTSYYSELGQIQSPNGNIQSGGSMHHGQSQISPVSLVTTSTVNSNNRLQMNGHSSQFGNGSTGTPPIPNAHGISPLVLPGSQMPVSQESKIIEYIKLLNSRIMNTAQMNGTGATDPAESNLGSLDMTQLALWNLYNGCAKPPVVQPQPQPQRCDVNDAPLDLGKKERTEAVKRESDESDDSDSDYELDTAANVSSQGSDNSTNCSPVVIKVKINGTKYRGILHPKVNTRKVGPI